MTRHNSRVGLLIIKENRQIYLSRKNNEDHLSLRSI